MYEEISGRFDGAFDSSSIIWLEELGTGNQVSILFLGRNSWQITEFYRIDCADGCQRLTKVSYYL